MPRIRRTFGKKTRKFDEQTFENDFRFPPKPDSYYLCVYYDNKIYGAE